MTTDLDETIARSRDWRSFVLNNGLYMFLIALLAIIIAINPSFFRPQNFITILTQSCTRIMLALGVAGIIVLGCVDLSLGRNMGMAAIVACSLLQRVGYSQRIFHNLPRLPVILPIVLVMVLCCLFLVAIALIVTKLKVEAFITSLGFALIIYGLESLYVDRLNDSSPIGGLDPAFSRFAQGAIEIQTFRIPYLILYAAVLIAAVWLIWHKTVLGKNMFAIGGNIEAATVSGVNIVFNSVLVFIIAGMLYGFSGALEGARTGSVTNLLGEGYELDAIAACVVGGVSLRGGVGSIAGVVTGVILFQIINYGLVYIGVNPYIQYSVKGLIIVLAIIIDSQKYIKRR